MLNVYARVLSFGVAVWCCSLHASPQNSGINEHFQYAGDAAHPATIDCSNLPPIDPAKDFVGNFNNNCYATRLSASRGGGYDGDLNALYSLIYFQVDPTYELILVGSFPNARFMSVTVYDTHDASTSSLADYEILPLRPSMSNPFTPNVLYQANQQYGVKVGFGGVSPVNPAAGCGTGSTTIDANFLDASMIHQGLSWNGYPGTFPVPFPIHHAGANTAGELMVRRYVDISGDPPPGVIVRRLSDGCAITAAQAIAQLTITTDHAIASAWANSVQTGAHQEFAYKIEPILCFPPDPLNQVQWERGPDYVPGGNTDYSGYLKFNVTTALIESIETAQEFIRLQFQEPTAPTIPCATGNCTLTGSEQLRYRSISFQVGATTLASIKDSDMVKDPNGNVTLIIGMGKQPPASVTAANYYTYFDMSTIPNYRGMTSVKIRDILPGPAFNCSVLNVPYFTTEYNPNGGFMGNYVPTVDFPTKTEIPTLPIPVGRQDTCGISPTSAPVACGYSH